MLKYHLQIEREQDGRWIAEVPALPGVMQYGKTRAEAIRRAEALALRVVAERIENSKTPPRSIEIAFA